MQEDYYSKKYLLTRPHSEVIAAAQRIPPGRALDLGCGNGRNSLYLQQKGFEVEGWDKSVASLQHLQSIMAAEKLSGITLTQCDLEQVTLDKRYDFIFSTVVLMFLQPEAVSSLIREMQNATQPGGFNLIVAAMDTADYPCSMPFPFTFSAGELANDYQGWEIVKYNENPGALHKVDQQGERIKMRFATLLAKKSAA
ncbi:tellurite resistance methyltransferase TehB [Pantoea sp. BAV 3049]|uniref:tellurite resistance methyltransferase TehB n=1 Tax=Pantoea sp. BAV 3049 TaxID=2654188 RepID=UPI00131E0D4C|nr:tellurite resistance methyltransferase TehB [Pantoea sp. BAV 3049]